MPYVITYKNVTDVPMFDVSIVDRIPAGFRYVEGSARIDREPVEPAVAGRELIWSDLAVDRQEEHEMLVLLAVGAGVSEGEFVNRVQAVHMLTGSALSNEASATVRVVPDPTFDCTDVTGKVFDDANRNGHQDLGETGLPGVRVVSARGLAATTDAHGRFHITCAVVPREGRGSNFVLKLDDRTLPSGFRSSTDQVKIERATRGKALQVQLRRLAPPRDRPGSRRCGVRAGHDRDARAVAAAARHADEGAAEGAGNAAPVVSRRRRERAAGPAPHGGDQERDRGPVAVAERRATS